MVSRKLPTRDLQSFFSPKRLPILWTPAARTPGPPILEIQTDSVLGEGSYSSQLLPSGSYESSRVN